MFVFGPYQFSDIGFSIGIPRFRVAKNNNVNEFGASSDSFPHNIMQFNHYGRFSGRERIANLYFT